MGERLAASFANPAVTLARSASDTFAGIRPADVPAFVAVRFVAAATATGLFAWFRPGPAPRPEPAAGDAEPLAPAAR